MTSTYLPKGTVYGTLLNFCDEVEAMQPLMNAAPYTAPPNAPVLYIKPANTWTPHGNAIPVPARVPEVEIGATIAMVIGPRAGELAGYVLMNDLSIPHASFFRPPVKFKCLDGFLGIGHAVVASADAGTASAFTLQVHINGQLRQSVAYTGLVRDGQRLLSDVSEFMTLHPGDVLMLGCDLGRPVGKVGDRIDIMAPGFPTLSNTLAAAAR